MTATWGASSPGIVQTAVGSYGRFVVADRDIAPGEVILNALPYAFGVAETHRKRVCAWCSRWSKVGRLSIVCNKCDTVYFCSQECFTMCMQPGVLGGDHGAICPFLRRVSKAASTKSAASLLKLAVLVLQRRLQEEAGAAFPVDLTRSTFDSRLPPRPDLDGAPPSDESTEDDGPTRATSLSTPEDVTDALVAETNQLTIEPEAADPPAPSELPSYMSPPTAEEATARALCQSEMLKNIDDNAIPPLRFRPSRWRDVQRLQGHIADWDADSVKMWKKDVQLLVEVAAAMSAPVTRDELLLLISQIESNCFGLWTSSFEVYGLAIYPLASYFNHACDCNCESDQDGALGFMQIKASHAIAAGTELTIKYINVDVPVSQRNVNLLRDYYFTCMCNRCVAEREQPGRAKHTYEKSTNGGGKARPPKKKLLYTTK